MHFWGWKYGKRDFILDFAKIVLVIFILIAISKSERPGPEYLICPFDCVLGSSMEFLPLSLALEQALFPPDSE